MDRRWGSALALVVPQTHFADASIPYSGAELRPHWIYETFGLMGDSLVAFLGPVDVHIDSMVDMADKVAGLSITGDSMLHFILESFGADLDRCVLLQKILVFVALEQLGPKVLPRISRRGDDIYLDDGKLTVSIATVSKVSCLIHFGINVTNAGTPIKTSSLADCDLEAKNYAESVLGRFAEEMDSMAKATTKVRGV